MNTATLIPLGSACPSWCVVDHDRHDRHPDDRADPLHRSEYFELSTPEDNDRRWVTPTLMQYGGETRIWVCDGLELTLDVAQQLVALLPGLIAQARGA